MKELLEKIRQDALSALNGDESSESIRIRFLGKKGELTSVLRGMGAVAPEERPKMGQLVNEVREKIEAAIAEKAEREKKSALEAKLKSEKIDVTIPGDDLSTGKRHPLAQTEALIREIFIGMGFSVVEGPEVEYDYYNFEALNLPKNHPARDTQDTFYITDNILLRSQTSPVQVRTMENTKPPIRVISPGRVYRADPADATHSPISISARDLSLTRESPWAILKACLSFLQRKCSARTQKYVSVLIISRSRSLPQRLTSPVGNAAARDAVSARAKAG